MDILHWELPSLLARESGQAAESPSASLCSVPELPAQPPCPPNPRAASMQAPPPSWCFCSSQGWAQLDQLREVEKLSQELPATSHPSLFTASPWSWFPSAVQLLRSLVWQEMCVQSKPSAAQVMFGSTFLLRNAPLRTSQVVQLCLLTLSSDILGWDEGAESTATPEKGRAPMPSLLSQDLQLGTLAQEAPIPTLGSTAGLPAAKMGSCPGPGEQGLCSWKCFKECRLEGMRGRWLHKQAGSAKAREVRGATGKNQKFQRNSTD